MTWITPWRKFFGVPKNCGVTDMNEATLSASLEDYLEAIFHIVRKKRAARPKDISRYLDVGNSSVTGALKALKARRLVNYAPYDVVNLTETFCIPFYQYIIGPWI